MTTRPRIGAAALAALALGGCELREVSLTEPEHTIVVEAYVRVGETAFGFPRNRATVLLHETLASDGSTGAVPGADVVIRRTTDGLSLAMQETALGDCATAVPANGAAGTCYLPGSGVLLSRLRPGDPLELRIELAGGGVLLSETVVPGSFQLHDVISNGSCDLTPGRLSEITWSPSAGAWAYISDTYLQGLGPIFGSAVVDDPLYLLGLSVSARDTTIVFPSEFGLFTRGEVDREVSLALQSGLPPGTSATVSVAAVDRNWVNWARGGSFNPSGLVRVPSVRGLGTGVFAAGVRHTFIVQAREPSGSLPACPAPPDAPLP